MRGVRQTRFESYLLRSSGLFGILEFSFLAECRRGGKDGLDDAEICLHVFTPLPRMRHLLGFRERPELCHNPNCSRL